MPAVAKKKGYHPPAIKPSHKGLLHKDTGTKEGANIPLSSLMQAKRSKDPAVRKRATFALNARHWRHGDRGGKGHGK